MIPSYNAVQNANISPMDLKQHLTVKRYTKLRKTMVIILILFFFLLGFVLGTQYTYYSLVASLNYAFQDSNINIAVQFNETRLVQEITKYAQQNIVNPKR